jgi:riboflavin-specific deaminase-like protein
LSVEPFDRQSEERFAPTADEHWPSGVEFGDPAIDANLPFGTEQTRNHAISDRTHLSSYQNFLWPSALIGKHRDPYAHSGRNTNCFVPAYCEKRFFYEGKRPVPLKNSYTPAAKTSRSAGENHSPIDGDASNLWAEFAQSFRNLVQPLPSPWGDLFEPLQTGAVDDLVVIAQIGQSLDGRIATASGHSKYINGPAGLAHLHRLRSLVDAVVIGVGTALADDPLLTVRRVAGPHPARVVLDPNGRLPASAKVFTGDGIRRLLVTAEGTQCALPSGVEILALPTADRHIAPPAILAALAARGLRRVLIEGGADTVSRFLTAGCLDRLHVMVAPIILGSGRASFILPPIERADQALRMPIRAHQLDNEVLFDCDLSAQRVPIGHAKTST